MFDKKIIVKLTEHEIESLMSALFTQESELKKMLKKTSPADIHSPDEEIRIELKKISKLIKKLGR